MSEQQTASACPHPEAVGTRWGDPIIEKRQAELQGYLDRWAAETDHGERKGPFDKERAGPPDMTSEVIRVLLTGADVSWLADRVDKRDVEQRLHLEGARLWGDHLKGAQLNGANLEGAHLYEAYLQNVNLSGATFNKASRLRAATLTSASLDQVTFDNTNLSVVNWKQVPILGDEVTAQTAKDSSGKRKSRQRRITEYQAALRAYRRLAVALQANGLSAESANYLYRASIMERRLARHERRFGAYFFSVLLAVLAGYGYRLGRIIVA